MMYEKLKAAVSFIANVGVQAIYIMGSIIEPKIW
jgi:hypothetical protein